MISFSLSAINPGFTSFMMMYRVLLMVILASCFYTPASAQSEAITVVLGNGSKLTLSSWSFVYYLVKSNEIVAQGSTSMPIQKRSQNLYLQERHEQKEGKEDFGKGSDLSINVKNLSSIEFAWNWQYSSLERVIITLTDGSKITRSRLGPIAPSCLGDDTFVYGKTLYLEGDYQVGNTLQHLNYNLNKWLKGNNTRKEIIEKIIF